MDKKLICVDDLLKTLKYDPELTKKIDELHDFAPLVNQYRFERDIAISQLGDIGFGFGEKMWHDPADLLPDEDEPIIAEFEWVSNDGRTFRGTDKGFFACGGWHGHLAIPREMKVLRWMRLPKSREFRNVEE